ncbi:nitrilase-related carbon-nitrogen hydrolase [Pelagibacterium lacus]|uniref:Amidohydrolase n=1 Tax=Pelagibacterium lacus TaxID=2282655 RepID=A0A369W4D2_9HYPH|nr:nitrilase-related carbon-nitrogen hydrolase [Pelagibacterium lacus]RDE09554.1 amidohydrolase [Pelagibacterium lacus]
MTIQPWRATCIQMPSVLATKAETPDAARAIIKANVAKAIELIDLACGGDNPPRVVVLPEFGLQGPPHGLTIDRWLDLAVCSVPGWISAPLQDAARRHGIYIGFNQFESDPQWPGRYFNSCALIDPRGEVILRYRRINTAAWPSPHDVMDQYLDHHGIDGTFPVVDTELGRIGMIACGEIAVPEVARCLMAQGAEIILHPTNEDNTPSQEAAKIARAAENMVYLISANVADGIGFSADGSVKGGRSRIIDFRGRTLAYREGSEPGVDVTAEIDVEALRQARRDTGMGNTLLRGRWEIYRPLLGNLAVYPPNSFAQRPMADISETAGPVQIGLDTLYGSGIVVPPDA